MEITRPMGPAHRSRRCCIGGRWGSRVLPDRRPGGNHEERNDRMFFVFDTETTGIPRSRKAQVTDLGNWPRVVELAWSLYDAAGEPVSAAEYRVRPDGFRIPADATWVHGITTADATAHGRPVAEVLTAFLADLDRAQTLVAHNLAFDRPILGAEFVRLGHDLQTVRGRFLDRPGVCTMKATIDLCAIPGRFGKPKFPSLEELHQRLFGEAPPAGHRALADVRATARCFFELRRRGVIG